MNIRMVSIDFNTADVKRREVFSFLPAAAEAALISVRESFPHLGCLLLSTCNRTELWISGSNQDDPSSGELLCKLKNVSFSHHQDLLTELEGEEAARHLFLLACGLKSKIMGEDQILSQVRDALDLARKAGTADGLLERTFQTAIAYAKRAKTETGIGHANLSVATGVLEAIRKYGAVNSKISAEARNLKCLVIGNGVIGRKTADCLIEAGHSVSVTLRRYRHGETIVPAGCTTIAYEDRYERLVDFDVVVSATVSPHYTLSFNEVAEKLTDGCRRLFFDLAVPSDIQEEVGTIAGVVLINIDGLSDDRIASETEEIAEAQKIIEEGIRELSNWYAFRDYIGEIDEIKSAASADILARVERIISRITVDESEKKELRGAFAKASQSVVGKMLFGLKETLDSEVWEPCFAALYEAATKPAVWEKHEGK